MRLIYKVKILTGFSFSIIFSCSSSSAISSLCFSTRSRNTDITLLGSKGSSLSTNVHVTDKLKAQF